jgi:hypothetical protein
MATERFSKTSFRDKLVRRMNAIQAVQKFNPNDGWNQVKNSPTERVVEYGRYVELRALIDDLN